MLHGDELLVRDPRPSPWRPHPAVAVGLVLMALTFLLHLMPMLVVAIAAGTVLGIQTTVAVDRGRRVGEDLAEPPSRARIARAVADGLVAAGLIPVAANIDDGEQVEGADPSTAPLLAALEEVLAAVDAPSYLIPRWILTGPVDNFHGQVALGRLRSNARVWHSVPAVMSTSDERAQAFAGAWDRWVGGGRPIATDSPEGRVILAQNRGVDPFATGTMVSRKG